MKMPKKAAVVLGVLSLLTASGLTARADAHVTTLAGTLTTAAVACDTLCTAGPLTGGLTGKYEFTMIEMTPTGIPNVSHYTGTAKITTEQGTLSGPDEGYWNLSTGDCIDYTTFTSGTGAYAGANGSMTIVGRYDLNTGKGLNHYVAFLK